MSHRPVKNSTLGLETLADVLGTAPQSLPTPEPEPIRTAEPAPETTAWKVITVRLSLDDYRWLRQQAHEASMQTGHRADASALLRRLVAEARSRQR